MNRIRFSRNGVQHCAKFCPIKKGQGLCLILPCHSRPNPFIPLTIHHLRPPLPILAPLSLAPSRPSHPAHASQPHRFGVNPWNEVFSHDRGTGQLSHDRGTGQLSNSLLAIKKGQGLCQIFPCHFRALHSFHSRSTTCSHLFPSLRPSLSLHPVPATRPTHHNRTGTRSDLPSPHHHPPRLL